MLFVFVGSFLLVLTVAVVVLLIEEEDDREEGQSGEDCEGDLDPTVGAGADDFTGAGVDQDAISFLLVAVDGQPHGQEDLLIGDADVLGLDGADLLVIAADVLAAELADSCVHDLLGGVKTFIEGDNVAFGFEAGEEFRAKTFEVVEVPGFQRIDIVAREGFGSTDQDIVEEMIDLAGDVGPAGLRTLAGLAVALGIGVGFGFPVIVAALAGVVGVGHRVVGPEGQVDAGELAEVGQLLEVIGGEPAGFDPGVEIVDGFAQGLFEGEQGFGADHGDGGGAGGVFEVGGAEGAFVGFDVVFEEDLCAAAGTADLGGAALDGAGVALRGAEFGEGLGVVVFDDLGGAGGDLFDVAAVGAFEGPVGGIEVEACAAVFAGEFAAFGGWIGDRWGLMLGDRRAGWVGAARRAGRC